mgnify:CR=1 FL=1
MFDAVSPTFVRALDQQHQYNNRDFDHRHGCVALARNGPWDGTGRERRGGEGEVRFYKPSTSNSRNNEIADGQPTMKQVSQSVSQSVSEQEVSKQVVDH